MAKELRGFAQKAVLPDMNAVLEKLKDEKPLSPADQGNLKSWIVGEAQHYIETERDFDVWNAQLQDMVKVAKEMWSSEPDYDKAIRLRVLIQRAAKVGAHIAYFVKQAESVKKFNAAIQKIGASERLALISLLEQKISTSNL
jgi:hypothetical protein